MTPIVNTNYHVTRRSYLELVGLHCGQPGGAVLDVRVQRGLGDGLHALELPHGPAEHHGERPVPVLMFCARIMMMMRIMTAAHPPPNETTLLHTPHTHARTHTRTRTHARTHARARTTTTTPPPPPPPTTTTTTTTTQATRAAATTTTTTTTIITT